jgi:hypothetical protein
MGVSHGTTIPVLGTTESIGHKVFLMLLLLLHIVTAQ